MMVAPAIVVVAVVKYTGNSIKSGYQLVHIVAPAMIFRGTSLCLMILRIT